MYRVSRVLLCGVLLCGVLLYAVAYASDTRVGVDSVGRSVPMPLQPQRVVIDDATHQLFLPLYELGVPVVGACFINQYTALPFIYALENQFKTSPQKIGVANICRAFDKGADIKKLTPDVYIGDTDKQYMDEGTFVLNLSKFTAVYLQDTLTYSPENSLQHQLANAFNVIEMYDSLNTAYQKRLAQVRAKLSFDTSTKTFAYAVLVRDNVKNRIIFRADNSGAYKAIRDLGFKMPDFMQGKIEFEITHKQLALLNQDILFLTTQGTQKGTKRQIHDMLQSVHADWKRFVPIATHGDTLYLDPLYTSPATFVSALNILDQIEWHFGKK